MTRRLAILIAVALLTSAQMPNSPTGRMAGALAQLAASDDPDALATFLSERKAASAADDLERWLAAMVRECGGGEIAGARKEGAYSAVLELSLSMGRCEVAYTVEPEPPHGLLTLGVDVMMGGPGPGGGGSKLDLPTGSDEELAAALAEELEQMAARDDFAGVVMLARNGEPFFERAYGLADRSSGRANTVDTRFDVGSITKLVTRIAVAQLAQNGELDLGATVQEVVTDYPNPKVGRRITVQQLLDHSSGLGDIFNDRWPSADKSKLVAPRDFFPLFADRPLAFEPGSQQAYSNAGFVLLGAVIEAASGQSYSDYVAEHVFKPAGMSDSGFPVRDGSDPGLAIGYFRDGDEIVDNLGRLPIRGCPAGSSSHTAADLLKLDRALRGGRLLEDKWTAWVYSREMEPNPERDWPIGFAGGGPGVSAIIEGDDKAMAIVVSNLGGPGGEGLGISLYRALRAAGE